MRNATGIDYSLARQLALAYHGTEDGKLVLELAQPDDRFSADGEDYAALQDALMSYGAQHVRDAKAMTAYERLAHCFR